MKNQKLKWIAFALVVVVSSGMLSHISEGTEYVMAYNHGIGETYATPISESAGNKGTEDNPLVILEIVPNESYAEIGYTIAGCEPVDIRRLEYDAENLGRIKKISSDLKSAEISENKETIKKFQLDPSDDPSQWTGPSADKISLNGYYIRVESGGEFSQVDSGDGSDEVIYKKTSDYSGNFNWVTYDWSKEVPAIVPPGRLTNADAPNVGDKVYTIREDVYYQSSRYLYKNKNLFLKNVIGLTNEEEIENYHVIVKTITPPKLNGTELGWIDRADLIYINSKNHSPNLPDIWRDYRIAGEVSGVTKFKEGNDLSWEAVIKIFHKAVLDTDKAGLILDQRIYTNKDSNGYEDKMQVSHQITYDGKLSNYANPKIKAYNNNIYKLYLMTQLMDARTFYNLFMSDHNGTTTPFVNESGTKGICTKRAKNPTNKEEEKYWNPYTFLFCNSNGTKASNTDWGKQVMKTNYRLNPSLSVAWNLNHRIFLLNGTQSIAAYLEESVEVPENYYTKQLPASDKTVANAINYILNNGGEDSINQNELRVLELQPCADYSLTDFRIRMFVPDFIGKVLITRQSSSEFIGKIEDLNSQYDLIYMGLNVGRFNTKTYTHNGKNRILPKYNDTSLNRKIYLHVGDVVHTLDPNNKSNQKMVYNASGASLSTTQVRFPGNDITALKKKALTEFIDAGYPILVHSDLYGNNTDKKPDPILVDNSSNIFKFINEMRHRAVEPENLIGEAQENANVLLKTYIKNVKPQIKFEIDASGREKKPKQYVGNPNGSGVIPNSQYINDVDPNNRTLSYTFKIDDGGINALYQINLFVDVNADGKFVESEKIATRTGYAGNNTIVLTKTLGKNFVGVIPWKLQICKDGDTNKRAETQGLSAIKNNGEKKEIRVLQVIPEDHITLDLTDNPNFRTYTQNLNDYKVTFMKRTVTQFQNMYASRKYEGPSDDQLIYKVKPDGSERGYHMIIFGFKDMYDNINNANGAMDNVMYFISQGKSVLFTHDTTSYNNDPSKPNAYGYNFDTKFRSTLSMDRFGVRDYLGHPTVNKDRATKPGGGKYPDIHGYCTGAIKKTRIGPDSNDELFAYNVTGKYGANNEATRQVAKLNEGQLTQYPYKIGGPDGKIGVAETHTQYYQLNLEDPDVVVWYTLAGNGDSNSLYTAAPYDASNSYYIYSKNNITYSGVGHSTVGSAIDEVKLFVNTFVAAYKNDMTPPDINILNDYTFLNSSDEYLMYINSDINANRTDVADPGHDAMMNEFDTGDKIKLVFQPIEYNLISGAVGIKVHYVNADGDVVTPAIYKESDDSIIYDPANPESNKFKKEDQYYKLNSGENYYIYYKKSDFNSADSRLITFEMINNIGAKGTRKVNLLRRTLFKLD